MSIVVPQNAGKFLTSSTTGGSSSGIRTHDLSVETGEGSSCLKLRVHSENVMVTKNCENPYVICSTLLIVQYFISTSSSAPRT
jgi:hypothetical protein